MPDPTTHPQAVVAPGDVPAPPPEPEAAASAGPRDALVEQDLLVEDVSIDGMCGVY
jgi:mycofactocin precursor